MLYAADILVYIHPVVSLFFLNASLSFFASVYLRKYHEESTNVSIVHFSLRRLSAVRADSMGK